MVLWGVRAATPPCPPGHHVKAKPMLMLLVERNVPKKTYAIATCDVLGLEAPVLSSVTEMAENEVPIVLMMFLYEARARACARAPRTEASSAQLGTHFCQRVKHPRRTIKVRRRRGRPLSPGLK